MPRVLLVKTSSLGDIVHNLPVVCDLKQARPDLSIDWVVEEAYADLPRLNPDVERVIAVAQRRWRKTESARAQEEKRQFEAELRAEAYDVVLDTQGLLKSAVLARGARLAPGGVRVGFSRKLAREGLARLFYDRGYDVDRKSHAVERIRSLAAQAFDYALEGLPRFGLRLASKRPAWLADEPYVVLLHATSRPEKSWPAARWRELANYLAERGYRVVLPHGTEREHRAADALAESMVSATVAPRLALGDAAHMLHSAKAVIGVDTGLTHLAAALDVPTVALFGATPRWRYAPYWTPRAISLGDHGVQPDVAEVEGALATLGLS